MRTPCMHRESTGTGITDDGTCKCQAFIAKSQMSLFCGPCFNGLFYITDTFNGTDQLQMYLKFFLFDKYIA